MRAMMVDAASRRALGLAIAVPALLWGGAALIAQRVFGLPPCEMCMWQRWPHMAALALALLAFMLRNQPVSRLLVWLAALAIAVSGVIGIYHAGVEYGWWEGLTRCATLPGASGGDFMKDIMSKPLVRCDVAAWTFAGISLAGFNAIFSLGSAAVIATLLMRRKP